jgi:CBS domain-containing protein
MKIRDFLTINDRPLITVGPSETLSVAIRKLVENDIGALPVCNDKGELVGIISQRDLLKECFQHSNAIGITEVQDVMTQRVVVGTPDDNLDYVTTVMKQNRISHLPVVVGQKVEGMISMRDNCNLQLTECKTQTRYIDLIPGRTHSRRQPLV